VTKTCKHRKRGLHTGVNGNTSDKETLFAYWRLKCQTCDKILIEQKRFLKDGGDFNEPRWYIAARLGAKLRELKEIKREDTPHIPRM